MQPRKCCINRVRNGKIDRSRCVGCTLCSQVCPYDAIALEERTQEEYLEAVYRSSRSREIGNIKLRGINIEGEYYLGQTVAEKIFQ